MPPPLHPVPTSAKGAPVEKEVAAPQPPQQAVETAAAVPPVKEQRTEAALATGTGKFVGRKISLDLQDADLVNVMRLFAEVANLNVILSPEVRGKVTVRMVNIPWDQAMDIILKMNGLGYVTEDSILRVASLAALGALGLARARPGGRRRGRR